jgi:hypothetical protein
MPLPSGASSTLTRAEIVRPKIAGVEAPARIKASNFRRDNPMLREA